MFENSRKRGVLASGAIVDSPAPYFSAKDPISALTHFIGLIAAIAGMPYLLIHASNRGANTLEMASYGIFALSMVALYGASSAYHAFNPASARARSALKKIDHMMIFLLIAGTYTPVCVNYIPFNVSMPMLMAVWTVAILGILFKAFWVNCPRWISSVIYIGMGWICVFAISVIFESLSTPAFLWLLAGGVFYTAGGVIYAVKLEFLRKIHPGFGAHELFHLFVMAGSFCHFMVMLS